MKIKILSLIICVLLIICISLGIMCTVLWSNHPHSITYIELVKNYDIGYKVIVLDSLVQKDTVTVEKKEYIQQYIEEIIYTTDTVTNIVPIYVPIKTEIITGKAIGIYPSHIFDYEATITGHKFQIDSIKLSNYPVIYKHIYYPKPSKFNFSLQTGFGYGMFHKRFDWFTGIGISYNF